MVVAAASAGWAGVYYATYAVRSQILGATDWHGRADTGEVSLTFDDGPGDDTEALLDVLADLKIKATFFMVGRQVELFPATARRIVADGHEIGNHSYSHPIYLYRSSRETWRQLERTQETIYQTTGVRPRLARPPCGVRTRAYFAATLSLGLRTVQWSVTGFDWKKRGANAIARDVVQDATGGSIILLHDGDSEGRCDRRETVAAIPLIVADLKSRNLAVAPLARLLQLEEKQAHPSCALTYE